MAKEEQDEKTEQLRKEIEQKGKDIEELQKKIEELRAQISQKDIPKTSEVDRMIGDVSQLLDSGFGIFGTSSTKREGRSESRGLFDIIGDLAKLAEESKNTRKTIDIDGKKGVIDFSIRTGPIKRSGRTSFAKPRRRVVRRKPYAPPTSEQIEKKEPLVDIFDEEDSIKVMAELPGVEKKDIYLELAEDLLIIKVNTPTREYYKEVKLPTVVEKEILESTYRNGILEVKLKKTINV